jgi:hypothetical protein
MIWTLPLKPSVLGVAVATGLLLCLSTDARKVRNERGDFDVLDFIDPFIGTANGGI